jgi:hypothetical protein
VIGVRQASKHIAAQHLWHNLADACGRVRRAQITKDELGRALLEFRLGLLASGRDKRKLINITQAVTNEMDRDGLDIVNAALQRNFWNADLDVCSWIRTLPVLIEDRVSGQQSRCLSLVRSLLRCGSEKQHRIRLHLT